MRVQILTLTLLISVVTGGTARAYVAEEEMLVKVANSCRLVGTQNQTSVAAPMGGSASALALVSKQPNEILSPLAMPGALVPVPYEYSSPKMMKIYVRGVDFEQMEPQALRALTTMLDDANADLMRESYDAADPEASKLYVHSAYRAYDVQCRLFNKKVAHEIELHPEMNELAAIANVNSRSALPGQSEHQLGTAADLVYNIPNMGYELEPEMDQTPGFAWLQANAFRYGFALSYPKGPGDLRAPNPRTGYVYEPWHWRYIGIAYATAYSMCARQGMTLQDYLRALRANPNMSCNDGVLR